MKKHHKLKVTSAMLLTAGLVASVLNITHGDVQAPGQSNLSVAKIANSVTSEKDIIKKHNYLPDILGRIGYAVLKAEQTQIDHIRNYQPPDVGVTYDDGTTGFIRTIVNTIKNESKMSSIEPDENKDAPIIDWSVIVERSNSKSENEPGVIHENDIFVEKSTDEPNSNTPIVDQPVITEKIIDKHEDRAIVENVNDKHSETVVSDKHEDKVVTEKVNDKHEDKVVTEKVNDKYAETVVIDKHEDKIIADKIVEKVNDKHAENVVSDKHDDKVIADKITEKVNDKHDDKIIADKIVEKVNDKHDDEVVTEKVVSDKHEDKVITEKVNDKHEDKVVTEKVNDKHVENVVSDKHEDKVITEKANDKHDDEDPSIIDEPLPWLDDQLPPDDFPEMDDSGFDDEMFDDWGGPDFEGIDYLPDFPLDSPEELLPIPDPSVPIPEVPPVVAPPETVAPIVTPTIEPPKLEVVTPAPTTEPVSPTTPTESHNDADTEVKMRQETVKIKQGQKLVYDDTLEKGDKRFVEGTPGQIIKTYKDTYHKGILSYSIPVAEETTVEPSPDILYVGSKVSIKASNIVDFKLGDKIKDFKVIEMKGDIEAFVNKDYHMLMNESEDVRFQKAISTIDASYLAQDPHESEPFDHTYMWLGVGDEMVTVFNSTNFVDKTKVNEYLVNYINMDREAKGLIKLKYDPILQPLTELRAQEMADYGHIRYQGKPHTRPDGTPWLTVLDQLPTDYKSPGFGENMLAYSVLSNPYQLVSEQWIAKRLFEQWKSSPPHYQAMMDPNYTRTAVSFKLTTRTGAKSENNTNWMIGAELFS